MESVSEIHVSDNLRDKYLTESRNFNENNLLQYIQTIHEIQDSLKWSTQPQIKFELAIVKMAKMPSVVDLENLLHSMNNYKKKRAIKSAQPTDKSGQTEDREDDLTMIQNKWADICNTVKTDKVVLGNALAHAKPVAVTSDSLTVQLSKTDAFQMNMINKNKRQLETSIKESFGKLLRIKIELTAAAPLTETAKSGDSKKILKHINENDPILNKLIDDLGLELS